MLVGNHSGGVAIDGAMVLASMFFDMDPPRLAQGMAEKFINKVPFASEWANRTGQFTGLPENAVRLLEDERLLVVFPEGARGTAKLYKERYSLVDFGTGFMRLALKTKTPIIPFAFTRRRRGHPHHHQRLCPRANLWRAIHPGHALPRRASPPRVPLHRVRRAAPLLRHRRRGRRHHRELRGRGEGQDRRAARAREGPPLEEEGAHAAETRDEGPHPRHLRRHRQEARPRISWPRVMRSPASTCARGPTRRRRSSSSPPISGSAPPRTSSARTAPRPSCTWPRSPRSSASARSATRINVGGTRAVFEHCKAYGVKHAIFVGRHTFYGAGPDSPLYHTEDEPPMALGTFPELADLVAADLYAANALWRTPELVTTVLRICYTLGPSGHGTLGTFLRGPRVPTILGFDPLFQFMHEDDVVRALALALEKQLRGVFNVAGPDPVPLSSLDSGDRAAGRSRCPSSCARPRSGASVYRSCPRVRSRTSSIRWWWTRRRFARRPGSVTTGTRRRRSRTSRARFLCSRHGDEQRLGVSACRSSGRRSSCCCRLPTDRRTRDRA